MEEPQTPSNLQTILNELELHRKQISGGRLKSYLFIGTGILFIAAGFILDTLFLAAAIAGGITLIIGFYILNKAAQNFNEYRHEFKQKVIAAALKSIDNSLELQYETGLSERNFINSALFTQRPDRYNSQDQVFGTAGNTKFSFSEVHAEYKTVTQTKNGRQEHWHTILKGIVFCADFNKNFNGTTVVRPKDFGAAIGAWISDKVSLFSPSTKNLVKLENTEFCETFVTYSTDQVEARYILTPSMMEKLCELDNQTKYTISVSFTNSYVFIAFPLTKDYFEPPVFKSLLDPKFLEEDLSIITFMYGIIRELDLNTRIWGKS